MSFKEEGKPSSFFIERGSGGSLYCEMSSSPALPNAGSILTSRGFMPKLAEVDYSNPSEERLCTIFGGFVDSMKTAGFSPLQTFGLMIGVAGMSEGRSQKTAALEEAMEKLAFEVPAAAAPAAPTPAHFGAPAAPVVPGTTGAGGLWDKAKAFFGSDQAKQNIILNTAATEHPGLHTLASSLFGDDHAGLAKFYADITGKVPGHEANYGNAASAAWGALKSKPFVKEWAPAVVPGLATMAASRMAGAGWGTSALLGVGAGALHATATNAGGYKPWLDHMINGAALPHKPGDPLPPGHLQGLTRRASAAGRAAVAPPPAEAPAAAAAAPAAPPAQQTIQQNSANAADIARQGKH
mgnify:CR=1 FL=1